MAVFGWFQLTVLTVFSISDNQWALKHFLCSSQLNNLGECSGTVVECLTRDRGASGSSLSCVTYVVSLSKNINPSLVLVKPRKTRPFMIERLLKGRKESNNTNKSNLVW